MDGDQVSLGEKSQQDNDTNKSPPDLVYSTRLSHQPPAAAMTI